MESNYTVPVINKLECELIFIFFKDAFLIVNSFAHKIDF